jgi:glucose dehydrogenase
MRRRVIAAGLALCCAAAQAEDGEWRMPAKDYASTRYSALGDITAANVKNLKLAFTFSTGVERGHEAAPIVADGALYIVTPWPNTVYALDFSGR